MKSLASCAVHHFITTDKMHRQLFESKMSGLGMHRSQHRVLMYLAEHKDFCPSQKEIADHFNISPAAVAVTLKKLETAGYIKKTTFDKDNRVNNVAITDKAVAVVEKTLKYTEEIERNIFKDLTDIEIEQFCNYLIRLQNSMAEYLDK